MSDNINNNSMDWRKVLGTVSVSDSDELMSMLINNGVKAETLRGNHHLQESSSKVQLQPAAQLPYQNILAGGPLFEAGSSSSQTQYPQIGMFTGGALLMNPLGIPYMCQKQEQLVPVVPAPSGKGPQSSQESLLVSDMPSNTRGRKRTPDEDEERRKMIKIKNRISAAKSRARRQEHTKFLEEKVEFLRNENAYLKKLLAWLEKDERERLPEEEEEIAGNAHSD